MLRILIIVTLLTTIGCFKNTNELGSKKNPIKIYFLPSVDSQTLEVSATALKDYLEKNTPYSYEIAIPQNYIAVVEAFGTNRADVAAINPFGYLLAHEKYGAEAGLTVIRHGKSTYQAMFIAKANSNIKSLSDFKGKKVAFVDPASTSGYRLPMQILKEKGYLPKESVFAMKHDSVVTMIYQGQVDAGAAYYAPPHEGEIQDARRLVKTQFPDIEEKVKIVELTYDIPNDPIIFRKGVSQKLRDEIAEGFIKFITTKEGREHFEKIYGVTAFVKATDKDYDKVREMLKNIGTSDPYEETSK